MALTKFATKAIGNQEGSLPSPAVLVGDAELVLQDGGDIAVNRGIEIHAALNEEDDGQDGPLLPLGKGKASRVVKLFFVDDHAAVGECFALDFIVLSAETTAGASWLSFVAFVDGMVMLVSVVVC